MKPLVLLLSLIAAAPLCGCSTNAATGRSQFGALSRTEEISMGSEARPEIIKEYGGEIGNTEVKGYVTEIGLKLAAQTESDNPTLPWTFTVLNSDIVNAFALPGGQIFISRGLLRRMTNEAQVAGVLGHEVGHVTARHINDRIVSERTTAITSAVLSAVLTEGLGAGLGGLTPRAVQLGGQTVVLSFGRDQEIEADRLGMRYMSRCNYNPAAQRQVMEILEAEAKGDPNPEWLSTHPYPKTRIEKIDQQLATTYKTIKDDPAYVFNEADFKAKCLSKLSAVPTDERPTLAAAGRFWWCGVCAEQERAAQSSHERVVQVSQGRVAQASGL